MSLSAQPIEALPRPAVPCSYYRRGRETPRWRQVEGCKRTHTMQAGISEGFGTRQTAVAAHYQPPLSRPSTRQHGPGAPPTASQNPAGFADRRGSCPPRRQLGRRTVHWEVVVWATGRFRWPGPVAVLGSGPVRRAGASHEGHPHPRGDRVLSS